jgi:periplasmic mercuric ion binding protein
MKTKFLSLICMFLIGTITVFAQTKTEKFKVYGNCGMCQARIEKAVKSIEGVKKAKWDSEKMILTVTFDESKVKLADIHKAVAKVGHDTDLEKADDAVYSALPGCCQYDRSKK